MIAVDTITDFERLDGLKEKWNRLWSLTPGATFSQSYDCYWAAAAAGDAIPCVFAAGASGRLVGLWAMFASSKRSRLGGHRLSCAGLDAAVPCLIGPSPTATAVIVAKHLRQAAGRTVVTFADTAPERPVTAAFEAAGFTCVGDAGPAVREVQLSDRWADIRDACDESTRLAVYRAQHASACEGYRFERLRPSGSVSCAAVREVLGISPAATKAERSYLKAAFKEAARRGAADLAFLRDGEAVVAASLSFITAGDLENRFAAVAPGARPSAGVRLFIELFRDSLARGDRKFFYQATDRHPALGWGTLVTRREVVTACSSVGPAVRLRLVGRSLRRVTAGGSMK